MPYIRTQEQFKDILNKIIDEVIKAVCKRTQELLRKHINTDTYGIGAYSDNVEGINELYLDGTGTPSYEFRDKAWNTKTIKRMRESLFSLFYDGSKLSPPSANSPYLHGNEYKNEDRREILAALLNVSGIAQQGDFNDREAQKRREPYWDNFINELSEKLGHWLFTEFNNRGINIPELRNTKF